MNITDIFPSLATKQSKEVNLNDEAILYLKAEGLMDSNWNWKRQNPLIHPEECAKFISWVHKKYSVEFSFGGYGENRSSLWHDTYLDNLGTYRHLGVDINIPSGTEIMSPITGRVIVSDHDKNYPKAPQNHGWGNRLIICPEDKEHAIILAHLSDATKRKVGTLIKKWEPLGTIWTSYENGGWFEHFHIQVILREKLMKLLEEGRLAELDGYAKNMDEETRRVYPNPFDSIQS